MLAKLLMCAWQYRQPLAWLVTRLTNIFSSSLTVPS